MPGYDVFLSHASADEGAVEALACKLRDQELLEVFFGKWDLVPGAPWQKASAFEASCRVSALGCELPANLGQATSVAGKPTLSE